METNKEKCIAREKDNHCIYCGEIIPEGMQVCKACEYELVYGYSIKDKHIRKRMNKSMDDGYRIHNKKKKGYGRR